MLAVQARPDTLQALGTACGLKGKVIALHGALQQRYPFIDRLALALYEASTGRLRTFLQSQAGEPPLSLYETLLEDAPALGALLETRAARVVQDLSVYDAGVHAHTQALRAQGYGSSYTLPFYWNGHLEAFVFFNSHEKGRFPEELLGELDAWGHLVGTLALCELGAVRALMAALRTANTMVHMKDPETGGHLERMAHFSRLIARHLSMTGKHPFDDETIEHIFAFAPLHDVGKLGVPDSVLMKTSALTGPEWQVMQRHPAAGLELIDAILRHFGAEHLEHVDLLRHVAESHHEMMDGSGYPSHLSGTAIPIVARIIAVADIFDALTSHRPYKEPWTNQDAFDYLRRQSEHKLDCDCVEALIEGGAEVERIQALFKG